MDFRHILPGTRAYYAYTDSQGVQKKEFGRVTMTDAFSFTLRFDTIWYSGLQTDSKGIANSWTFKDAVSIREVTFIPDKFVLQDKVRFTTGKYKGQEGVLYDYEGASLMIDIEHNAVPCKANELELVGRKRLI